MTTYSRESETESIVEHQPLNAPPAKVDMETEPTEVEERAEGAAMDCEDSNTKPDMLTFSVSSSPAEENCNATRSPNSSPEMETEFVNRDCERLKESPLTNPNAENLTGDFSPPSRRRSLRSASRIPGKYLSAPAKNARPRSRKLKLNGNSSPAKTIGARVAKRPRQSICLTKSPVKKPTVLLARPVEVTEYFTNISATLVSHRVNLMPFLAMRKRIDRLVGEAIAKTKIQRENNPVNVNVL